MSRKTIIVLTLFLAACCAMALEASFQKKLVLVPSGTPPSDWSSLPEVEPLLTVPSFPGDVSLRGVTWGESFTGVVPEGYTLLSVVMQEFRWKVNGSVAPGMQYGNYLAEQCLSQTNSVEIDVLPGSNPPMQFGVLVDDLIDVGGATEACPGRYTNANTAHDYFAYTGDVVNRIEIIGYDLCVSDREAFLWQ